MTTLIKCRSGNRIAELSGLQACPCLQRLDISNNALVNLSTVAPLDSLRELHLVMSSLAATCGYPACLRKIQRKMIVYSLLLIKAGNKISSLAGLENLPSLEILDLQVVKNRKLAIRLHTHKKSKHAYAHLTCGYTQTHFCTSKHPSTERAPCAFTGTPPPLYIYIYIYYYTPGIRVSLNIQTRNAQKQHHQKCIANSKTKLHPPLKSRR